MEGMEVEGTAFGWLSSFSRKEVIITGELGRWGLLGRSVGILIETNGGVWGSGENKSVFIIDCSVLIL